MTTLIDCEIFPDDDACFNVLGATSGDKMLKAQFTFLGTAFSIFLGAALQLFRYRSASDYYADGSSVYSSRNYWKLSNTLP